MMDKCNFRLGEPNTNKCYFKSYRTLWNGMKSDCDGEDNCMLFQLYKNIVKR